MIDPQLLLHGEGNTIMYEQNEALREQLFKLFSTGASSRSQPRAVAAATAVLPAADRLRRRTSTYDNIFRVIIMQFLDAHNFDVRSVKKTCVHIVHPDGRIIPFDTYNLFYRDGLEHTRLAPLRARAELSMKGSSA